jgi:hypothetical protein
MPNLIDIAFLKAELHPRGYKLDSSREFPVFWKRIEQNDTRSKFAFSVVTVTLHSHSLRIEGLNETRLMREIKAGKITIEKEEDINDHQETIFETTLDTFGKMKIILDFFEKQIQIIAAEPIYSNDYKQALKNIELIVDAANQVDMED